MAYSLKCRQKSSDNNFDKIIFFRHLFDPERKIEIPKPSFASTRHAKSDPRI